MAKAVITIEDTNEGMIHATIEFEPAVKTHGDCSDAQYAALKCLEAIGKMAGDEEDFEDGL